MRHVTAERVSRRQSSLPVRTVARMTEPASAAVSHSETTPAQSLRSSWSRARNYFASDARRVVQTILGLLWLLDGALQFQSFMYSPAFVHTLVADASGQPGWLSSSIKWAARFAGSDLAVYNTLFAVTQVALGLGLLCRRTVSLALAGSVAWALVVWWVGEGFGMLFTDTASPLTGAPGAVLLYALVALIAWPTSRPLGLFGDRGARAAWAILWLVMAWLWLSAANSSADATSTAVNSTASGIGVLTSLQDSVADAAAGNGLTIALALALTSAVIGLTVALDVRRRSFLALAVALSLAYWVVGQGLGGIFTGSATDPNAGPLFVLLAFAMYTGAGNRQPMRRPLLRRVQLTLLN